MKALTSIQQALLNIVLYKPSAVRALMATIKNKQYATGYLNYLLPYRVGIEIDLVGVPHKLQQEIEEIYGRLDAENKPAILEDQGYFGKRVYSKKKRLMAMSFTGTEPGNRPMHETVEIRMSFQKVSQLKHFKALLDLLKEEASKLNPTTGLAANGGIHVHINLGKYRYTHDEADERIQNELRTWYTYLRRNVFGIPFKEKASWENDYEDPKRNVAQCSTRNITWDRHHKSIEYRMGTPTLEYTTIMKWVLCCSVMNRGIRMNSPFNKELTDRIIAS